MTNPNPTETHALICRKCGAGYMEATSQDGEPEYSENYQCNHCGHIATIPSLTIIASQIITGFIGSLTSVFLAIEELDKIVLDISQDDGSASGESFLLLFLATVFFAGFLFIINKGSEGLKMRKRYHTRIPPMASPPKKKL